MSLTYSQDKHPDVERSELQHRGRLLRWGETLLRLLLEALLIGSVIVVTALAECGVIPTNKSGYYCGDPKLSFVDHGDTISTSTLLIVSFVTPLLLFCLVEYFTYPEKLDPNKTPLQYASGRAGQALLWYRLYLMGLGLTFSLTELGKNIIGEPRPVFLDICRPDPGYNCTAGYVLDYTCTNKNVSIGYMTDAYRSFPSGHSSTSWYTAVFVMWFIRVRIPTNVSCFFVPWLHYVCAVWGLVCSLTRVADHKHHWWDVLAGSVLGASVAIFTCQYLWRTRPSFHPAEKDNRNGTV